MDPLRKMIGSRSYAIRVEKLYGTLTDNSAAGAVRKSWRNQARQSIAVFVQSSGTGTTKASIQAFYVRQLRQAGREPPQAAALAFRER
jgi:hypothetical protein